MNELQTLLEQLQTRLRESGDNVAASVLLEDAASGAAIPQSHLTKIQKWMTKPESIETERIHTWPTLMITENPTRNMVIYTPESQKTAVKKWPGTPFLYNASAQSAGFWSNGADHTLQAASQFGRIYDAKLVKTKEGVIGTLGWFYTVEGISDDIDAFIEKMNSGIHREVSIHFSVPQGVMCSICNDAFSKCQENSGTYHYPGEKYGKQTCYMSTGKGLLVPLELSAVACPGSLDAHVMQDDELEDLKPVSLREALGGARDVIATIPRQENNVDPKEAQKRLIEAAKAAGVKLAEFIADDKNKEIVTQAKVTTENFREVLGVEADPPDDDKCEKCGKKECSCEKSKENTPAPKRALFEGKCPVCLREGKEHAPQSADETAIREEFQAAVSEVVEKANARVEAAETKAAGFDALKEERDAMFVDLVESTVTLAIDKGVKKADERDAYRESLKALSYQAVKEVRAPLLAMPMVQTEATPEQMRERMSERFKAQNGAVEVQQTEDGRKRSVDARRPRFAAK